MTKWHAKLPCMQIVKQNNKGIKPCENVSVVRKQKKHNTVIWVVPDSPVQSTLFTLDRQYSNQVSENSCVEAVPSTPPSEVVWSK